ncbi:MAG: MGMT family protein [Ketobacteraceae bacterium]|nr:MGMT family protein [Ketobacteraceae bacterium]
MHQDPTLKQRILHTVALIPRGKVCTYGRVAEYAGAKRRARYVGTVLKQLPEGSALPWHRVINAQGQCSFPEGSPQQEMQLTRLAQEGVPVVNGKVSLDLYLWRP